MVKILLFLILVIGLVYVGVDLVMETPEQPQPQTFIVGDVKPTIFEVGSGDVLSWYDAQRESRLALNKYRSLKEDTEDQEEWEFESRYRNVRSSIDGKMIVGYVKDLDNPDFKEVE